MQVDRTGMQHPGGRGAVHRAQDAGGFAPVVLAGFVLGAPQPGDDFLADNRPAVFWGRGAEDRVIAAPAVSRTDSWLPLHTSLTKRVYPGLGHGIHAAEMVDVRDFLAQHGGVGHGGQP